MTLFEMAVENNRRRTSYGMQGLGYLTYQQAMERAGLTANCDPRDSACVAMNQARQNAVAAVWDATGGKIPEDATFNIGPIDSSQVQAFMNNQPPVAPVTVSTGGVSQSYTPASSLATYQGPNQNNSLYANMPTVTNPTAVNIPVANVPATATTYHPVLSLSTSRGSGGVYQVGDSWTLTISGGQPGASVSVKGGKNGSQSVTSWGSLDGSGKLVIVGQFSADQVGSWNENWMVNGVSVGTISFVIQQPVTSSSSSNLTEGVTQTPSAGGGVSPVYDLTTGYPTWLTAGTAYGIDSSPTPVVSTPTSSSGFSDFITSVETWLGESMFGGIPNWVLVGGGVAIVAWQHKERRGHGR